MEDVYTHLNGTQERIKPEESKIQRVLMRRIAFFTSIFLPVLWVVFLSADGLSQDGPWKRMNEGLSLAEFDPPQKPLVKDSKIVILKIDPQYYSFKLLCASELGKIRLTAKEWCRRYGLLSAINAGMYQKDGLTNVGYMKTFSHVNNPRLNSAYKAVLAFNRVEPAVPEIQIIDLKCHDFDAVKSRYQTFVQNIRMISCTQENVWAKQDRMWSLAVLGMDKAGNALFIFSEGPYSGHDFNTLLLSLPVSIYNAMYLEGGPEASLYYSAHGVELDQSGIYETGLNENPVRPGARPIPNIIGITKKTK